MVRLEHVNLVVKDLQPSIEFLLLALPWWRIRGEGEGLWGTTPRRWVHIGDDDYYITLNDQGEGEIRALDGIEPGLAHIGFVVDDLDGLMQRLAQKGFKCEIEGRQHRFRRTVYYRDPAGFQFEFMQYYSNKADEKNRYGGEFGELVHH